MTYTITRNDAFQSVDIAFDSRPSEAVRNVLKSLRFRWHAAKKVWYGYGINEDDARAAIESVMTPGHSEAATEAAVKAAAAPETPRENDPCKFDKRMLNAQYAMVWSDHMLVYCVGKTAALAELPGGELFPVEKQSIETRFCFGESGYDYDDALKAAQHARESQEYFKRKNMEYYTRMIDDITETMGDDASRLMVIYTDGTYTDQPAECRIRDFAAVRTVQVLDALGGSANLDELTASGQVFEFQGRNARLAKPDEIRIILNAWKAAANAHEKKVDAYLKRYGLSKVHSWTYWRDA